MDIRFNSKHIRLLDGFPRTVSTLCLQPKQYDDCLCSAAEEGTLYICASQLITSQFYRVHCHLLLPLRVEEELYCIKAILTLTVRFV